MSSILYHHCYRRITFEVPFAAFLYQSKKTRTLTEWLHYIGSKRHTMVGSELAKRDMSSYRYSCEIATFLQEFSRMYNHITCKTTFLSTAYNFAFPFFPASAYLSFSNFFKSALLIFPLIVLGKKLASTNSTFRGYLYGAAFFLQKSCSSLTSSSRFACFSDMVLAAELVNTMKALTTSSR